MHEPLVALELALLERAVVVELHRHLTQLDVGARLLREEARGDRARILEVDHELVGPGGGGRLAREREHAERRLVEGERDHLTALRERLPRAQKERHARPAPVVEPHLERDERLGLGLRIDALLLAIALVLSPDHALGIDRLHRVEHLRGLVSHGLLGESRGRLHRDEPEHLEEVRDDHVAEGAGLLVEAGATRDGERLGNVDLDVVDVVSVPDRLEEAVREAQGEDVLDGLLAQEVVDPKDVGLAEHPVHGRVELSCGGEIPSERLLDDDAGAFGEAGLAEHGDDPGKGGRRDGQVIDAARLAADLPLGLLDGPDELRRVVGAGSREGEAGDELVPTLSGSLAHAALLDGVVRALPKLLVGERARRAGDADHAVVLGHEAGAVEVEEPRQELALGEIARRPEEHDHVVLRTWARRRPSCDCLSDLRREVDVRRPRVVLPEDGAAGDEQVRTGLPDLGRVVGRDAPVHLHEDGVGHEGA